jgi:hypothetical protein
MPLWQTTGVTIHTFRNECYELPWLDDCSLCLIIRNDNSCPFFNVWAMNISIYGTSINRLVASHS